MDRVEGIPWEWVLDSQPWHFNRMKIILFYFLCTNPEITSWLYFFHSRRQSEKCLLPLLMNTCSKVVKNKSDFVNMSGKSWRMMKVILSENGRNLCLYTGTGSIHRECLLCLFLRALYDNIKRVFSQDANVCCVDSPKIRINFITLNMLKRFRFDLSSASFWQWYMLKAGIWTENSPHNRAMYASEWNTFRLIKFSLKIHLAHVQRTHEYRDCMNYMNSDGKELELI